MPGFSSVGRAFDCSSIYLSKRYSGYQNVAGSNPASRKLISILYNLEILIEV